MKFSRSAKIESAVKADQSRYEMRHVYLDVTEPATSEAFGSGRMIATNGQMLAIVPVVIEEHDVAGFVTVEALKAARKAGVRYHEATLKANGSLSIPNGASYPRPTDGERAPTDRVLAIVPAEKTPGSVTMRFNANLLATLASAIGADDGFVEITAIAGAGPMRVMCGKDGTLGVLMPTTGGVEFTPADTLQG